MIVDVETARYLVAVTENIANLPASAKTDVCPECSSVLSVDYFDDAHVMVHDGDTVAVVIACEGYWAVNPALVGITRPNWQPQTEV